MYLADWVIKQEVEESKLIDPFKEENLTPNGYDLSIEKIGVFGRKEWVIYPHTDFIILTEETINMPQHLLGNLWIKTKWARKGIKLHAGVVDAGFKGKLNLMCSSSCNTLTRFKKGDKFAQIVFAQVYKPEKLYAKRSGHYQNQKDVIK